MMIMMMATASATTTKKDDCIDKLTFLEINCCCCCCCCILFHFFCIISIKYLIHFDIFILHWQSSSPTIHILFAFSRYAYIHVEKSTYNLYSGFTLYQCIYISYEKINCAAKITILKRDKRCEDCRMKILVNIIHIRASWDLLSCKWSH